MEELTELMRCRFTDQSFTKPKKKPTILYTHFVHIRLLKKKRSTFLTHSNAADFI